MKSGAPATATGTTGTTGSMPSAGSIPSAYALDGSDAELKTHVGHKVEVTGTPAARQESSRTGEPAPPASTQSAAAAPRLKVSSVRMIAADCSPK
jgi:hypothetical protein